MVRRKPLQAAKFVGIPLAVVLGVSGFLRIIDARAIVNDPVLGDGQFLALILLPLVSLGLVFVVFVETVVTGVRSLRAEQSIRVQAAGSTGYVLVRGAEAAVAVVGVAIMATAVPVLFAESTPAPAGVGVMLLLVAVGLGILGVSFIRSFAELFVYNRTTGS